MAVLPEPMLLPDPVERISALHAERREELEERGWGLADVYLQLGGGGPGSSELHARFAEFFNGQVRSVLDEEDRAKLEYWAGIPERGVALRGRAIEALGDGADAPGTTVAEKGAEHGGLDAETRSLILAHNQLDLELHAHFAAAAERERRRAAARRTSARSAVCVLGMSRSGTSVTARILNILGVELGDETELMEPASGNNPAGFWEHGGIADLNEDILATLGEAPRQRWRYPPALPDGWERDPRLEPHRRAARSMLQESFAGKPLWGWKDPRTCLTLPFWQQLLAEMPGVGPNLRYVICVRHPLEVAASLRERDGMGREESLRLWHRYMSDVLRHTDDQPRLFVSYESYFGGWEEQAARLAAFLEKPPPSAATGAEVALHLDEGLRHHRQGEAASAERQLPADVAALYTRLTELAAQA